MPFVSLFRIQYVILNECWRLVNDGVMSVEDVDKVMSDGLGKDMGKWKMALVIKSKTGG